MSVHLVVYLGIITALEKWMDSVLEQKNQHLPSQEHPAGSVLDLEKPTFIFCIPLIFLACFLKTIKFSHVPPKKRKALYPDLII